MPGRCIENPGGIDRVELRMIENVVEFPAEREHTLFTPQIEIPEQRRIEVAPARSPDRVFGSITDVASARKGNAGCIEEPVDALLGSCEVGVTG